MQSPVLERLVGGAVLVALLLLLALLIGPRDGTRKPDEGGAEVPSAGDAPQLSESVATAFPAEAGAGDDTVSSIPSGSSGAVPPSVSPAPLADNKARADAAPSPTAAVAPPPTDAAPPPPPAAVPAPAASWAVQVGSFSSRANADRLSQWCREQGYGVMVLAGQDGARTLYRVRVGPYASRDDARSAVAELALLGRSGFVSDWENASP